MTRGRSLARLAKSNPRRLETLGRTLCGIRQGSRSTESGPRSCGSLCRSVQHCQRQKMMQRLLGAGIRAASGRRRTTAGDGSNSCSVENPIPPNCSSAGRSISLVAGGREPEKGGTLQQPHWLADSVRPAESAASALRQQSQSAAFGEPTQQRSLHDPQFH